MTKIAPRVSVYIVNHNYGRFLERAIESVLSQTMENYELLIIDNGSTDNYAPITRKYAKYITLFVDPSRPHPNPQDHHHPLHHHHPRQSEAV